MSRLAVGWALFALAVFPASSLAETPDDLFHPRAGAIAQNFLALAVTAVPGKDSEPVVHKWTGPVRVGVLGSPTELGLRSLNLNLHHLRSLTRLDIAGGHDGNLLLAFVDHPPAAALGSYRRLTQQFFPGEPNLEERVAELTAHRKHCLGFVGFRDHAIAAGLLFVQRDREPEIIHACLVHELARLVGVMGEIPGTAYSAFATRGVWIDLTRQDELFLRLLYDERIEPGMSGPEVLPIIEDVLAGQP